MKENSDFHFVPEFTLQYILHTWYLSIPQSGANGNITYLFTLPCCSHSRNAITWLLGRDEQCNFRFRIGVWYSLLICSTRTDTISPEHHQTCNISAVSDCRSWHPELWLSCCEGNGQTLTVSSSSPALWLPWSASAGIGSNIAVAETKQLQADCRGKRRCIMFTHWFGRHSSHNGSEGNKSPVFLQGKGVLFLLTFWMFSVNYGFNF